MSSRKTSGKLSATRRRELQVAGAVAREAIISLHVERALELIQHAAGRVPALRMLDIYLRLLGLTGATAEVVTNRVLAAIGRKGVTENAEAALLSDAHDEGGGEERSLLRTLKGRLRGRVHDALRRTVELHTGATQAALLDLHVKHARAFVGMVADSHAIEAACQLYAELVHVPATLAPVLYILVLDELAAEELPRTWAPAAQPPAISPDRVPELGTHARSQQPHRTRRPA